MTNKRPTKLSYIEKTTGFSVSHVLEELPTYESFCKTVSKDKRILVNESCSTDEKWFPGIVNIHQRKIGIAKNNIYAFLDGNSICASEFYDWAFQAEDKSNNSMITGLYKQYRPMFAFEGNYSVLSKAPFVIFAFGININHEKLERTMNQFFDSTKLNPKKLSEKDILDFNARKRDIITSIDDAYEKMHRFKDFSADFGYELMQKNQLYDRFVHGADFGA